MKDTIKYDLAECLERGLRQGAEWLDAVNLTPLDLPGGMDAHFSVRKTSGKGAFNIGRKWAAETSNKYAPVSLKLINTIALSDQPLAESKEEILAAANRNDRAFFLQLAKVLKDNPGEINDHIIYNGISTHASLITSLWCDALLWLMTDKAGVQFFDSVMGLAISEASYKMNRLRYQMFKHRDSPVCGVRQCSDQTTKLRAHRPVTLENGQVLVAKARPACELVFRKGWTLTAKGLFGPSR